jgi:hypothetical protein
MHSPDKKNFDELMERLGETFSKPVTDLMKQTYWVALKDQPWEIVEACANSHCRYGKFFPKPAELRPKGEKHVEQDSAAIERNEKFIVDTWEQLRQRDPEQYWIAFKAAYLARLPFRFAPNSAEYRDAERRCIERCDAELKTPSRYATGRVAEAADDFF